MFTIKNCKTDSNPRPLVILMIVWPRPLA